MSVVPVTGPQSARVLDRHSTRRRIQRAAGAERWLRRTEQKDGTKAQQALFAVPGHPFTSARRQDRRVSAFMRAQLRPCTLQMSRGALKLETIPWKDPER